MLGLPSAEPGSAVVVAVRGDLDELVGDREGEFLRRGGQLGDVYALEGGFAVVLTALARWRSLPGWTRPGGMAGSTILL